MAEQPGGGEFLGSGWRFPLALGDGGEVLRATGEDSIHDAVWLVLSTAPGERIMRPDFGCGIHDLVFGVPDAATIGLVARQVRDALARWEPRIDVLDVSVGPQPGAATTLLVQVRYRIRTTNSVFNMVFPFYLERSPT